MSLLILKDKLIVGLIVGFLIFTVIPAQAGHSYSKTYVAGIGDATVICDKGNVGDTCLGGGVFDMDYDQIHGGYFRIEIDDWLTDPVSGAYRYHPGGEIVEFCGFVEGEAPDDVESMTVWVDTAYAIINHGATCNPGTIGEIWIHQ